MQRIRACSRPFKRKLGDVLRRGTFKGALKEDNPDDASVHAERYMLAKRSRNDGEI